LKPEASGAAAAVLAAASRTLLQVAFEGRSFEDAFERASADSTADAPRAAVRAVALGSLRWYWQLAALAERLLGERSMVPSLRALLIASLHQLERSRNPVEATVSSAVDATRILQQPRASGMVNALLRRFLRERERLLEETLRDAQAASAHPGWLLESLRSTYPTQWRDIVEANNAHPPMTLRLDLSRTTREAYQAQLRRSGLSARELAWPATALVLDTPVPVVRLPGFAEGLVSVQDAGAQLAAVLLAAAPGERVLDACAAPGGKTGALLEAADGRIDLTSIDVDAGRLKLVASNLERLRRQARCVVADLASDVSWWDGRGFDGILLDAPCSSTGVLRRHPDIRLLRRSADIPAFAAMQRTLLERCLALLKPGGRLLYSTCSLLPAENEQIIEQVLAAGLGSAVPIDLPAACTLPWLPTAHGMQLLPSTEAPTDGFYYACLTVT
jgi:16S rRNA (cytosine967-C5)-methyltransferase